MKRLRKGTKSLAYGLVGFTFFLLIPALLFWQDLVSAIEWQGGVRFRLTFAFLVAVLLLSYAILPAELKSRIGRYSMPIIIGVSLPVTFYLFGANLDAEFGVIDDHEIVLYLGVDRELPAAEAVERIQSANFGNPQGHKRYRPSYYTLRMLETYLWGARPILWYATRMIIAALFMVVAWYIIGKHLGMLAGFLTVMYITTSLPWIDIFSRLGPAEAYGVLGTTVFAAGSYLLIKARSQTRRSGTEALYWILVMMGALVALGSKENLIIISVPTVLLAALAFTDRRNRVAAFIAATAVLTLTTLSVWATLLAVGAAGATIYGESVEPIGRLAIIAATLTSVPGMAMAIALVALTALWTTMKGKSHQKLRETTVKTLLVVVALLTVYLSQHVFYNGELKPNRYSFPGAFAYKPAFFLVIAWYLWSASKLKGDWIRSSAAGYTVGAALMIAMLSYPGTVQSRVLSNVHLTQSFDARLEHVVATLRHYPDSRLVVESHDRHDYEPIFSWSRHLRARGIENELLLRIHGYSSESLSDTLRITIANGLELVSREGGRGYSGWPDLEILSGRCFSLHLSAESDTECLNL